MFRSILTTLLFSLTSLPMALGAEFVVTSSQDNGEGSLREALIAANNAQGASEIIFQIDPETNSLTTEGKALIYVQTPLPDISGRFPVSIKAQKNIILDGDKSKSKFPGLTITSSDNIIQGLVIQHFGDGGILIHGTDAANTSGNVLVQNHVLDNGIYDQNGNSGDGIRLAVNVRNTLIYENLIARNRGNGIALESLTSAVWGNRIFGNFITANQKNGLLVAGSRNIFGLNPDNKPAPNVVTFNNLHGYLFNGNFSHGNKLSYDYVGLGPDEKAMGNKLEGIHVKLGAKNNNFGPGVKIFFNGRGVVIKGKNSVGNTLTDSEIIGHISEGLIIENIDAEPATRIANNNIAQNESDGLLIRGSSPVLENNIIKDNIRFGIHLQTSDEGNPDVFVNRDLRYSSPVITGNTVAKNRDGGIYALDTIFPGWEKVEQNNVLNKNFQFDAAVDWYHIFSFKAKSHTFGALQAEITNCTNEGKDSCVGSTVRELGDKYFVGPTQTFSLTNRETFFRVRHFEVVNNTRNTFSPHNVILSGDEEKVFLLSDLDRAQKVLDEEFELSASVIGDGAPAVSGPEHQTHIGVFGQKAYKVLWVWYVIGVGLLFWLYHFWIAGHKIQSQNKVFDTGRPEDEAPEESTSLKVKKSKSRTKKTASKKTSPKKAETKKTVAKTTKTVKKSPTKKK